MSSLGVIDFLNLVQTITTQLIYMAFYCNQDLFLTDAGNILLLLLLQNHFTTLSLHDRKRVTLKHCSLFSDIYCRNGWTPLQFLLRQHSCSIVSSLNKLGIKVQYQKVRSLWKSLLNYKSSTKLLTPICL